MLNAIGIVFCSAVLGVCFNILIKPGELLMYYARWVNITLKAPTILKKLLICPHCISGQISLWWSVYSIVFIGTDMMVFISVPWTIITVYLINEKINESKN